MTGLFYSFCYLRMAVYSVYLGFTLYWVCFFPSKCTLGKKLSRSRQCSRTSLHLRMSFSGIKKDWFPNWLNCFFCTVQRHGVLWRWNMCSHFRWAVCEKVLFSPQSQSPDLWVLPPFHVTRFFNHHYCFCSISYNTV